MASTEKRSTLKTTIISDGQGRLLWSGAGPPRLELGAPEGSLGKSFNAGCPGFRYGRSNPGA
ncbi:hypothetical protein [Streptomyces lavendulae]